MEVKTSILFISVLTLFCFMLPGFILRKTKIVTEKFAVVLSQLVLYVAQVAMLIHGFVTGFDKEVFKGVLWVVFLSFLAHAMFYILAKQMFHSAPDKIRRVLQFGVIFSNAGYMGIPVISDVFGEAAVIYASVYVISFNVFSFSLGRLIYTDDKKYISVKEIFINPAVIPIIIGIIVYVTGVGGFVQDCLARDDMGSRLVGLVYNVLTVLKNMVAPASMMVIGARLADIDFKGIFRDRYLYSYLFVRLFLFPGLVWALTIPLEKFGIVPHIIRAILLVLTSTPGAAATTMFAELYDGDSPYAGKIVAISTICAIVTMPAVSLLLSIA